MNKETSSFSGVILSVSEVATIDRKDKKPFRKRLIGIKKEDGQVGYFESRKELEKELPAGMKVTVHYYFAGSSKNDKCYNNVIISHMQCHDNG